MPALSCTKYLSHDSSKMDRELTAEIWSKESNLRDYVCVYALFTHLTVIFAMLLSKSNNLPTERWVLQSIACFSCLVPERTTFKDSSHVFPSLQRVLSSGERDDAVDDVFRARRHLLAARSLCLNSLLLQLPGRSDFDRFGNQNLCRKHLWSLGLRVLERSHSCIFSDFFVASRNLL